MHCTHHDAFRFFTAAARPRNAVAPARADQVAFEQPGCLHATMDLYKWAYKLSPATPGELLADCLALAADVRELDMRASPYDLADLGHPPVRIETPAGRAEYARAQAGFTRRAAPLRERLVDLCDAVLADLGGATRRSVHRRTERRVRSTTVRDGRAGQMCAGTGSPGFPSGAAYAATGGQEQTRLRSPCAPSTRRTGGHTLRSCTPGVPPVG